MNNLGSSVDDVIYLKKEPPGGLFDVFLIIFVDLNRQF